MLKKCVKVFRNKNKKKYNYLYKWIQEHLKINSDLLINSNYIQYLNHIENHLNLNNNQYLKLEIRKEKQRNMKNKKKI